MRLDQWTDFASYKQAADTHQRETAMENINRGGSAAFVQNNPDYFACDENSALINGWLSNNGDVPMTRLNLELAVRELKDDLKTAPAPEPEVVDNWASVTRIGDGMEMYVPGNEEAKALAKLADDPNLNDHQRKVRLKKLALLAGEQRRKFSNLPPGNDPKIVI